MPKRFVYYSRTEPARTIIWTVSLFTLLAGLWIFTPWFVPTDFSPAVKQAVDMGGIYWSAAVNCLLALPGLYGAWKGSHKWLARGAFNMFIWYLFVTLTRILAVDASPATLIWVPTLIIALCCAVCFIEQSQYARIFNDGGRIGAGRDD